MMKKIGYTNEVESWVTESIDKLSNTEGFQLERREEEEKKTIQKRSNCECSTFNKNLLVMTYEWDTLILVCSDI